MVGNPNLCILYREGKERALRSGVVGFGWSASCSWPVTKLADECILMSPIFRNRIGGALTLYLYERPHTCGFPDEPKVSYVVPFWVIYYNLYTKKLYNKPDRELHYRALGRELYPSTLEKRHVKVCSCIHRRAADVMSGNQASGAQSALQELSSSRAVCDHAHNTCSICKFSTRQQCAQAGHP